MSAQSNTDTAVAPFWSGWQNAVVNGVYPLHRLLNGSQYSAVFLSERKGQAVPNAAVKIIPIERVTLAQLAHWRLSTGLSHPHLIQLLDAGVCQLGGQPYLFVVMEYAEQTLYEVLGQRALTADEVREMLPPVLDALAFLHAQGLVQGQLKPANILVVNDQVKLASDGIRPAGAPRVGSAESSVYDPPEAARAPFSSAGDMWGLGVTLVEALTQGLPSLDEQSGAVVLPTTVPPACLHVVQQCLSLNPAMRPSATGLQTLLGCAPELPRAPPIPDPSGRRKPKTVFVALVLFMILAVVWADLRLSRSHTDAARSTAVNAQPTAPQPAALPDVAAQSAAPHLQGTGVVHEQLPGVSRAALGTIHGRIRIAVLVVVDHAGAVIQAHLKNTGPSAYFARLAREAARKWTFVPVADPASREWVLQFEFSRSGVKGGATPGS